jgi:recombinational DNA repair ATPase RecF
VKITQLTAENFKRLKAVEIAVEGKNIVILSGRNAQGKSSVLDAIWAALAGRDGVKEVKRPIRDGEKRAHVEITLDDIVVTRKWSAAGSTLEVKSAAGAKFPSPQKMLDDLIGKLSFDPLAFAQSDPKAQLATLIDLAELDFDPDENERLRKESYNRRTEVNRDVKRLQAQLSLSTGNG